MKKHWMIFIRESDGIHFLYNGEHPLKISPDCNIRWHHDHGELPATEQELLDEVNETPRKRIFSIKGYGRYRVVTRGQFLEI